MTIAPRMLDHDYLLGLLMEHAPVGITVLTTDLRYVLVSREAGERMIGLPEAEIIGRHCYDLVGQYQDDPDREGLERACDGCPALRALATGECSASVRNVREGSVIHMRAVPLVDRTGDVVGVMTVLENIAEKVTDPLTGVHNYRYYDEIMAQEGYRAARYGTPLSLLALDLDHFKHVNDRWGHVEGDRLLREIARSLQATVRESDHLCRIGGDEFAVLAPHTTRRQARALARRMQHAVLDGFAEYGLSISVGEASMPTDTGDPRLLREIADRRLYQAKAELSRRPLVTRRPGPRNEASRPAGGTRGAPSSPRR